MVFVIHYPANVTVKKDGVVLFVTNNAQGSPNATGMAIVMMTQVCARYQYKMMQILVLNSSFDFQQDTVSVTKISSAIQKINANIFVQTKNVEIMDFVVFKLETVFVKQATWDRIVFQPVTLTFAKMVQNVR